MSGAVACFTIAGFIGFGMAWLFIDWAWRKWSEYRDREAMRVRDNNMRKYGLTSERRSSTTKGDWYL